jgi:hypothetical protein
VNPSFFAFFDYYAFVGAIFGMFFTLSGIWFGSYLRSRRSREKLVERIQFNSDRLNQIIEYFQNGGLPNFTLDTPGLVVWLHSSADVIDKTLSEDIDWYRYQLDHIKIKLDIIYNKTGYDFNDPEKMNEALKASLRLALGFDLISHMRQELVRGENLQKRLMKK